MKICARMARLITLLAIQINAVSAATTASMMMSGSQLRSMTMAKMHMSSKAEIMAHMTIEKATRVLRSMNRSQGPELAALIETTLGVSSKRRSLRTSVQDNHVKKDDTHTTSGAHTMLSEMMFDTSQKLELEEIECHNFDQEQMRIMEMTKQDVSSFNSQAADARSRIFKAQAQIGFLNEKLPEVREELRGHNHQCGEDVSAIKTQLRIVIADIEVMKTILQMTACNNSDGTALVQCPKCGSAIMLQHTAIQAQLNKLNSQESRDLVQTNFQSLFHESRAGNSPVVLTQEQVTHMRHILRTTQTSRVLRHLHHRSRIDPPNAYTQDAPPYALNVSDVPKSPERHDCIETNRCVLDPGPNCFKLRDRFYRIRAGIEDKKTQLEQDLVNLERFCKEEKDNFEAQIRGMEETLREEGTKMATAITDQNDAEAGSHLKATQHVDMVKEYQEKMKECCDSRNQMRSENCALEKIRGELNKLIHYDIIVTDCEMGDWMETECPVTCGGSKMTKHRSVMVLPENGGMECLPQQMQLDCNADPCPVDCKLEEWAGWSSCSAECDGGVRERSRSIIVRDAHGADPCDETEEAEACGSQACDKDCTLSEWTKWGSCTKACGHGFQMRTKSVDETARGTGQCWGPDAEQRLEYKSCNNFECEAILPWNKPMLTCNSKVDLILLLDGSGSLDGNSWDKVKIMAETLVMSLNGAQDKVKMALMMFGGPNSWNDYEACTTYTVNQTVNKETQCGIKWVSHFTSNVSEVSTKISGLVQANTTTLTSVALGEAESELVQGRQDANSVVIVFTDAYPMSQLQTEAAARRLREKARVIWVPVGKSAPYELIEKMASKPEEDHIIQIGDMHMEHYSFVLNHIIASACPLVS